MISAGQIGGGATPAATAPAATAPVVAPTAIPEMSLAPGGVTMPVPGENTSMPARTPEQASAYYNAQVGLINNASASLAPKAWYQDPNVLNGITNLGSQFFGWLTQTAFFDMQQSIIEKQWDATQRIALDRDSLQEKAIDAATAADERMNGPNGLRKQLANIDANKQLAMYDRHETALERINASNSAGNNFVGRNDYSYGSPSVMG